MALWCHMVVGISVKVMVCCLMPPNHNLNQYWITISELFQYLFQGNIYLNTQDSTFVSFLNIEMAQIAEIFPHENNLFILYRQYHGCRWPGNARNQTISSHCFRPNYLGLCRFQHQNGEGLYISGLFQDFGYSIANTLELLQSCAKPSLL